MSEIIAVCLIAWVSSVVMGNLGCANRTAANPRDDELFFGDDAKVKTDE